MMIRIITATAVCALLCSPLAQADVDHPNEHHPTDSATHSEMIKRLEEITENISFLDPELFPQDFVELVPFTVEGRLRFIEKDVPMSYNEHVRSFIETYSGRRYKNHIGRMLGLSEYYFPIFERIFEETGLPEEIKYLAIVESALNPNAVSRMGATGPWQFMFATARMFDLEIDNYVDERKDPFAASYAASAYLRDAYDQFGDWLLAIASYNCGPGNVMRAIKRSGLEDPDYWQIWPYLPRETRNYVPAYIAMAYMFAFHEEHDITPIVPNMHFDTEEVAVNSHVSLSNIASALDLDVATLKTLNPAYKRDVVNGSAEKPRRIVLPGVEPTHYPALYAALSHRTPKDMAILNAAVTDDSSRPASHRVRRGDSLGKIAQRHGVTVQDLRAWNNLKSNTIMPGQNLRIADRGGASSSESSTSSSSSYITYKVKRGDTLSTISSRHRGSSINRIKADNGLSNSQIRVGMTLKITTM